MRNIKLIIQYDGTCYHGWQIQPDVLTVEEVLLDRLEKIIGERVKLSAAARTDSGVHARCQVASFKTTSSILPERFSLALNGLLPEDIVVAKVSLAPDSFNARYSARARIYRYTILNRTFRSPFDSRHCYFFPYQVDLNAVNRAVKFLVGEHDFSSFQAGRGRERVNRIRTVEKLKLFSRAGFIHVDIQADGFLTHMVRIVMGTLLDVGRGKILPEDVKEILKAKNRQKAGPTLPAKGLCLMKVVY
jgi:tRNA pseudouridine38-40 synthase